MQKFILTAGFVLAIGTIVSAQRFFTRDALVQFNSETPIEKIEAINKSGTAVLDTETGRMEWKVLIKNFIFEKALMQEHFNENYMESSTYTSSTFKGRVTNLSSVHFGKDGTYKVKAKGKMTIHGVDQNIEVPGTIIVEQGNIRIKSGFVLACADYGIKIPGVVRDKIAKEIAVTVEAALKPMRKK